MYFLEWLEHVNHHSLRLILKELAWGDEIVLVCGACDHKELGTVYRNEILVHEINVSDLRFEQLAGTTPEEVHEVPGLPAFLHEVSKEFATDEPDELMNGFEKAMEMYQ